jgi:hypothetical protein
MDLAHRRRMYSARSGRRGGVARLECCGRWIAACRRLELAGVRRSAALAKLGAPRELS